MCSLGETESNVPLASPPTVVAPTLTGFQAYTLPVLPPDIAHSLSLGSANIATCRADRSRIMQVIYDDLRARIGLYV